MIGVAKSGWGLEQFRDYAAASLRLNGMDPDARPRREDARPAALRRRRPRRRRHLHRDVAARWATGKRALFYLEVPPPLFGRIAQGIATAGRAEGARVMVEKPFGTDLASAQELNDTMHEFFPEDGDLPGRPLAGPGPAGERAVRPVRQLGPRAAAQPRPTWRASRSRWPRRSTSPTAAASTTATGAIRDVVQNHMLQVLATVLADPPDGARPRLLAGRQGAGDRRAAAADPGRTPSAASTRATSTSTASRPARPRRPSSRSGWPWTPGAGPASRS